MNTYQVRHELRMFCSCVFRCTLLNSSCVTWKRGKHCLAFNLPKYFGENLLCMHAKLLSHVPLFATPWTLALGAPLSIGFPRQEYWIELPFPPPEDLPDTGFEPASPVSPAWQVDSLPLSHLGSP